MSADRCARLQGKGPGGRMGREGVNGRAEGNERTCIVSFLLHREELRLT